jgi:hypothetical protein
MAQLKDQLLYINCMNKKTLKIYDIKLEAYMKKYIYKYFDIVSIFDIDNVNLSSYKLVLVNATCFKYNITGISKEELFKKMDKIKNIENVVIFLHDIHDYSFNFDPEIIPEIYLQNVNGINIYAPVLNENDAKILYDNFFQKFNISHLISLYDCPEYDFFVKRFSTIKKFYLTNHGYPNDIFRPISCCKEYDVLFYGKNFLPAYPLRYKLSQVFLRSGLRFKFVKYKRQSEKNLCDLINRSWMCISCVSNFSYFVRKYLEISACNSIVIGDINKQGFDIIGSNMVFINNQMKKKQILDKAKFYLTNKEILTALSFNKLDQVENQNYDCQIDKIGKICHSIINNDFCEYIYDSYQPLNNDVHEIMHRKILIDTEFIQNDNNLYLNFKISNGLYVLVCSELLSTTNIIVFDENNNKISRRETFVSDITEQNIFYVPFKIKTNETAIRLSGIKDISNIKLYRIERIGNFSNI